jgi:hypothetical protein
MNGCISCSASASTRPDRDSRLGKRAHRTDQTTLAVWQRWPYIKAKTPGAVRWHSPSVIDSISSFSALRMLLAPGQLLQHPRSDRHVVTF